MKKIIFTVLLTTPLLVYFLFFKSEKTKKIGVYIGESSICWDDQCKTFKELIPKEFLLVPPADDFPLCQIIEKGWCAMETGTATGTLKGYFNDSLQVRSFWRSRLAKD